MDEDDYLKKHYDVVICGTGLVESIIACAASRCRLSVLHLDRNDFYGSDCAAFNLKTFVNLVRCCPDDCGAEMVPNLGLIRVVESTTYAEENPAQLPDVDTPTAIPSTSPEDSNAVLASEPAPVVESAFDALMRQSRRFCLDMSVKLLYAAGYSCQQFVNSGVVNYLEFRSMDGLTYLDNNSVSIVPCSKSDMFNSRFFSSLEKRVLTKFLHFVSDYGRVADGADINTLNERELAQGRSLHRPQNKDINAAGYDVERYLKASFREFLAYCKLSTRLQQIIIHSLCFHIRHTSDDLTTERGIQLLAAHLNAVGRFGQTALLFPLYGVSELPQAFCRMAAVWGATYVLRTALANVEVLDDLVELKLEAIVPDSETSATQQASSDFANCDGSTAVNASSRNQIRVTTCEGRSFTCDAFIGNVDELCANTAIKTNILGHFEIPSVLATRVLVCQCSSPGGSNSLPLSKCLEIIPPMHPAIGNPHAIFVVQADSSTCVCPDGSLVLHIITQVDTAAYDDATAARVAIDLGDSSSSNNSSMRSVSGAALWDDLVAKMTASVTSMVTKVQNVLQQQHQLNIVQSLTTLKPLYHVNEASGCVQSTSLSATASLSSSDSNIRSANQLPNFAICGESASAYSITTDTAVKQAQRIFNKLFPNLIFMLNIDQEEAVHNEDFIGDDEMESLTAECHPSAEDVIDPATVAAQDQNRDADATSQMVNAGEKVSEGIDAMIEATDAVQDVRDNE